MDGGAEQGDPEQYGGSPAAVAEEARYLFREGMLRVARATGTAEREWLREAIDALSDTVP